MEVIHYLWESIKTWFCSSIHIEWIEWIALKECEYFRKLRVLLFSLDLETTHLTLGSERRESY